MTLFQVPAYCPICGAIFPSVMELDNSSNIKISNSVAGPCPNGHMGRVMDGTFDALNGLLSIRDAGPVSRSVLQKVREIAERAAAGNVDPASALDQITDLLPPGSAAAIKKLGAKNPLVAILIVLAFIYYMSGIVNNLTTGYRNIFPSAPVPRRSSNTTSPSRTVSHPAIVARAALRSRSNGSRPGA